MTPRRLFALVLAAVVAACSTGADPDPESTPASVPDEPNPAARQPFEAGELASLEVPRSDPSASADEIAAVVAADRALGLDLFRVSATDDNLMLSRYSIATALSMVYAGAKGTTAEEMAAAMHLEGSEETLDPVRNALDRALAEATWEPPKDDTREPFEIRPVNSAWGQGGYPFLDDYLETLARYYGAGLRLVDYLGQPEAARQVINDWTAETTDGRIVDLVPADAIDDATRLVLVNAIWFHANWVHQFDPEQTRDGPFTLADGTEVTVPLMSADGLRTGYFEDERLQAIRLPYTGDAAMVVVLPKEGSPTDLAAELGPGDMDLVWEDRLVDLIFPRFEFESRLQLNDALQRLGVAEAFVPPAGDSGADFTGITSERELFLSAALHQSFVAVDEFGTEAAAATAMVMMATSAPPPVEFRADRPFLFWIEHAPTGSPLFLGQLTDPR